ELLQVDRDLLHGCGQHLRQDDLMRDGQKLSQQRLDDLLDLELLLSRDLLLAGELLAGELRLHVGLLREAYVLLRESPELLGLTEVLPDAQRSREAGRIALLGGHALKGRALRGNWGSHKRPPSDIVAYCPVIPDCRPTKLPTVQ